MFKDYKAAETFIADYGDMLSQLDRKRIIVTNRSQGNNEFGSTGRKPCARWRWSKEIRSYRIPSGKKYRASNWWARSKLSTAYQPIKLNGYGVARVSIFNRLYQSDLSKTYYVQGNTYLREHLNDFCAIVHMQVYSSNTNYPLDRGDETRTVLSMPTLGLNNLSQEERDKK